MVDQTRWRNGHILSVSQFSVHLLMIFLFFFLIKFKVVKWFACPFKHLLANLFISFIFLKNNRYFKGLQSHCFQFTVKTGRKDGLFWKTISLVTMMGMETMRRILEQLISRIARKKNHIIFLIQVILDAPILRLVHPRLAHPRLDHPRLAYPRPTRHLILLLDILAIFIKINSI